MWEQRESIATMSKKESVENTNESIVAQTPSFQLGTYHKKALVVLLHCYYGNRQTLTYSELSQRLDVGEKTKAWQCEAWRDLKGNAYIVSSSADKKKYELSFPNGVQLASTLVSEEELADFQPAATNEKLHERIKARIARDGKAAKYGAKLFDLMAAPDYVPLNRNELAAKFNTLADSHGFFYALKWLKDQGYAEFCGPQEISALKKNECKSSVTTDKPEEVTSGKKRGVTSNENVDEMNQPKAKKRTTTKKRTGGKPLKLSKKAYVH